MLALDYFNQNVDRKREAWNQRGILPILVFFFSLASSVRALNENAMGSLIRQFDPGNSCEVLSKIDCFLRCRMSSAMSKCDFEPVATLTAMGNTLESYRSLCRPAKGDAAENGKHWAKKCSCKHLRKSEASSIWLREIEEWQKSDRDKRF